MGGVLVSVDKVSKGYAIVVYRGKDYRRPTSLRPKNLLTKRKAFAQSIELQRGEVCLIIVICHLDLHWGFCRKYSFLVKSCLNRHKREIILFLCCNNFLISEKLIHCLRVLCIYGSSLFINSLYGVI